MNIYCTIQLGKITLNSNGTFTIYHCKNGWMSSNGEEFTSLDEALKELEKDHKLPHLYLTKLTDTKSSSASKDQWIFSKFALQSLTNALNTE